MKKPLLYFILALFLAACNNDKQNTRNQTPSLFLPPKSVALNTEEGHPVNQFSGDSIPFLIGRQGDTLLTGKPFLVKKHVIPFEELFETTRIRAGSPEVLPINTNKHEIPAQLPTISINKDSLKSFTLEVDSTIAEIAILGDTFRSGIPIPAKVKVVPAIYPKPFKALPPRFKDATNHNIQYLDVNQGLPSSYVWCVLEDKRGNIWLGTSNGVCKYDGETFIQFTEQEGLLNNNAMSMMEDENGNIWFGSQWDDGICKYDGENFTYYLSREGFPCFKVTTIEEDSKGNIWFGSRCGAWKFDGKNFTLYDQSQGFVSNVVSDILEDKNGLLWFATRDNRNIITLGTGVSGFDGKHFINYTAKDGLSTYNITSMLEDKSGNIWFGTIGGGVTRYNGENFTHFTKKQGLSSNIVESILEDRNGALWFGTTDGGINKYDGVYFTHYTKKEGLPNNQVSFIMEDRSGNLWLSNLGSGLSILKEKSFTHFTENQGFSSNLVLSMLEDEKGDLWFGTQGDGLYKYRADTLTHYTVKEGLSDNVINYIEQDKNGDIWIIKGFRVICKFDGKYFTHHKSRDGFGIERFMLEERNGDLWFSALSGPLFKYDGKDMTFLKEGNRFVGFSIFAILEDKNGDLWFGSKGEGVGRYDGKNFTIYSEKEGLSDNKVTSLLEDKNGAIWIGTDGGGVNKFDGKSFTYYTKKQGLVANGTWSLQEDSYGNIWVGTQAGISVIRSGDQTDHTGLHDSILEASSKDLIVNYTIENGLKANDYYTNSLIDSKNRAWWSCAKSLTMLDFGDFDLHDQPPVVQLNYLEINEQYFDYRNMVDSLKGKIKFPEVAKFSNYPLNPSLTHNKNHLTFYFSAIDWAAPNKLKYSYRIEGLDKNWSNPSEEAKAEFRNLPQGTFTFKVRAVGEAQIWSEAAEYSFTILPPWWWSPWSKSLYLLVGLGFLFGVYRFQLKRQLASAEAQRLEELDIFKSRLYTNITHEFRTPLTVISGMADQILEHPDTWFREGLAMIKRNSRNLLGLVNQMLDLSKLDSGKFPIHLIQSDLIAYLKYLNDSFHSYAESKDIHLHMLSEVKELYMDFDPEKIQTIFSNLVGNAFKFTPPGGDVHISIQEHKTDQSYCRIRVTDTGVGIAESKLPYIFDRFYQADDWVTRQVEGTGIGLSLTRELVKLLDGTIEVTSQVGKGTEFTVLLPVYQPAERGTPETALVGSLFQTPAAKATKGLFLSTGKHDLPLVLLIEDNPDVLRYLSACLQDHYRLETALNGLQGIEKAIELVPDIIISDIMMPEKDGFEVCDTLKQDERTSHIPIILLTAKATMEDRVAGLEAGADAYLTKPFNQQELFVRLEKLVDIRRRLQARYQDLNLSGATQHKNFQKEDAFLQKVNRAIEDHLANENFDATALCSAVNYSRSQLYHKLNALTGRSVAIYIRTIRLRRAKELLESTSLNISEIAYEVGFKDPSYFTRKYREEFGITPTQARK